MPDTWYLLEPQEDPLASHRSDWKNEASAFEVLTGPCPYLTAGQPVTSSRRLALKSVHRSSYACRILLPSTVSPRLGGYSVTMEKTPSLSRPSMPRLAPRRRFAVVIGTACLTLVTFVTACSGGSGSEAPSQPPVALTYYQDTKSIIDARCATCHRKGDIGSFPLTNFEEVSAVASSLPKSIESGSMPPWQPSADCNQYAFDRSLSSDERQKLLACRRPRERSREASFRRIQDGRAGQHA